MNGIQTGEFNKVPIRETVSMLTIDRVQVLCPANRLQ